MKLALRLACLTALPLALAACQGEKKAAEKGGTAQGEILPGSASDAMLPYDTVRSQPPLAPPPTDAPKAGKGKGPAVSAADDADAADEGPGDPPTEEAPAPKAAAPKAAE
jgi:hypothetical protein